MQPWGLGVGLLYIWTYSGIILARAICTSPKDVKQHWIILQSSLESCGHVEMCSLERSSRRMAEGKYLFVYLKWTCCEMWMFDKAVDLNPIKKKQFIATLFSWQKCIEHGGHWLTLAGISFREFCFTKQISSLLMFDSRAIQRNQRWEIWTGRGHFGVTTFIWKWNQILILRETEKSKPLKEGKNTNVFFMKTCAKALEVFLHSNI